jgi:hypothetical protein
MDYQLTKNTIQLLKYAPILFLMNAYWMLSNKQIFDGQVNQRITSDKQMPSGHSLVSTLRVSQATPVLVFTIASACIFFLQKNFKRHLQSLGYRPKVMEVKVDQELPSFHNAIKISDA